MDGCHEQETRPRSNSRNSARTSGGRAHSRPAAAVAVVTWVEAAATWVAVIWVAASAAVTWAASVAAIWAAADWVVACTRRNRWRPHRRWNGPSMGSQASPAGGRRSVPDMWPASAALTRQVRRRHRRHFFVGGLGSTATATLLGWHLDAARLAVQLAVRLLMPGTHGRVGKGAKAPCPRIVARHQDVGHAASRLCPPYESMLEI